MGLDGLCGNLLLLRIISIVKLMVKIIQILVPLVLIITITISFYHIISNSEKGFEKVKIKLKNGIIGMFAVFLAPIIINNIMSSLTGENKIAACYFEADTELASWEEFIDDEYEFGEEIIVKGNYSSSKKNNTNPEQTTEDNETVESVTIGSSTVTGDTAKLIDIAKQEWLKIVHGNFHYSKTHSDTIPLKPNSVDCSSYVSDVLYYFGYTDFAGKQHRTKNFMATNWNKKYGWTEIPIAGGEDATSLLKPGDIFVRTNVSNGKVGYGHVTFIVAIENGKVYAYDCGSSSHWQTESPITLGKFLKDKRPGKIIRVT